MKFLIEYSNIDYHEQASDATENRSHVLQVQCLYSKAVFIKVSSSVQTTNGRIPRWQLAWDLYTEIHYIKKCIIHFWLYSELKQNLILVSFIILIPSICPPLSRVALCDPGAGRLHAQHFPAFITAEKRPLDFSIMVYVIIIIIIN